MREVQKYGRYALYTVLTVLLSFGFDTEDRGTVLAVLAVGAMAAAAAHWCWTLRVHGQEHTEQPVVGCQHCRVRADQQRRQATRDTEQAEMDRLHGRYD